MKPESVDRLLAYGLWPTLAVLQLAAGFPLFLVIYSLVCGAVVAVYRLCRCGV